MARYQVWFRQKGEGDELDSVHATRECAEARMAALWLDSYWMRDVWIVEIKEFTGADALNRIFGGE